MAQQTQSDIKKYDELVDTIDYGEVVTHMAAGKITHYETVQSHKSEQNNKPKQPKPADLDKFNRRDRNG